MTTAATLAKGLNRPCINCVHYIERLYSVNRKPMDGLGWCEHPEFDTPRPDFVTGEMIRTNPPEARKVRAAPELCGMTGVNWRLGHGGKSMTERELEIRTRDRNKIHADPEGEPGALGLDGK